MRVYITGQKQLGADVFRLCRSLGHEVMGVCAPAESGSGPGGMDRLRAAAEHEGVPWTVAGSLKAEDVPAGTDLIIAAHSHDFVSRRTRLRARLGAIGYHPSLLPLHRGRDAVRWTIRDGDRITGGSVYWLSDRVDGGDIAAQDWCFVRSDDDAGTLWRRELHPMALRLFRRVLTDLAGGLLVSVPQDEALATWEPAMDAPPLHRPELQLIGAGLPVGMTVRRDGNALRGIA